MDIQISIMHLESEYIYIYIKSMIWCDRKKIEKMSDGNRLLKLRDIQISLSKLKILLR